MASITKSVKSYVVVRIIFISHGTPKLVNITGTQHFFSQALGFPPEMVAINAPTLAKAAVGLNWLAR
jgi:uncharacterized membrane protein YphA (DoxX/SURF4 family)